MYKNGKISEYERVASYPCSNCYSLAKNFTATAVGLAYDRGLLDIEDFVVDYFPNDLSAQADKNLSAVKIKHLLTQTMGLAEGSLFERDRYTHGTDDWVRFALSARLPFKPGEKFIYSSSTYYLLSCVVEKATGMTTDLFLQKNLFSKIGITQFAWERCPKGHTLGAGGLYLPTADLLKLGILYLHGGVWNGNRVLSENWVHMATTKRPEFAHIPTAFSFWLGENGAYQGRGAHGQFLSVYPSAELVFAVHSFEDKNLGPLFERFLEETELC